MIKSKIKIKIQNLDSFALRLFCFLLALLFTATLPAKEITDYKPGDTITEDIFTPVPLTVIDPDATAALKLKEATRVSSILRFDPAVADQSEAEVRALFTQNRSNFLRLVKSSFNRTKLDDAAIASAKFQRALATFKRTHKSFPLSTNLAELWARGDSGRVAQSALIAQVRQAMAQPIRPANLPEDFKLSYVVRLVTLAESGAALTMADVEQRGVNLLRTNVLTLTRARTNLQGRFPPAEVALGKFAAARLRPNTFAEVRLTAEDRARRTDSLLSADNYEAGRLIARAGQTVDKKILAALDQLREKTAPVRLQEQITVQSAQAAQIQRRNQWLIAGLAVIAVLSVAIAWRLARRKPTVSLLPARITGDAASPAISFSPGGETIVVSTAAVRAGVFAQMTQLFREKLVRGLIAQRGQLLDAQQTAAAEMADLERRLNELQSPLQDRLHAYETRIAELEKALAAKGDENRELIKAKIQLIRRQLEAERSRNRLVMN